MTPFGLPHPGCNGSLWNIESPYCEKEELIFSFYGNVNSMYFRNMAYKEPLVYSVSEIGEDCDEKTIGLEVMEMI